MKLIWWKLKMSYHTVSPRWDGPPVVCHLFLYLFICALTTAFSWFVKILYITTLWYFFFLSHNPSLCRVSFLKGTYNCQNCLRRQFVKVCAQKHIKVNWKTLHPFLPPSISSLNLSPIQNFKEALPMPHGPPPNVFYNTSFFQKLSFFPVFRIRILLSASKNSKKNFDSYCFVTNFLTFI